MKKNFVFVIDRKSSISYNLLSGAFDRKNVVSFYHTLKCGKGLFIKIFNKVARIRDKYVRVSKKVCKQDYKDKIVVFTNESLNKMPTDALLKIKKEAKATVLFFIDETFNDYESIRNAKSFLERREEFFDLVYSFSEKDAKDCGFLWNMAYYPKFCVKDNKSLSDVFFVGNVKDRKQFLTDLAETLNGKGNTFNFYVDGIKDMPASFGWHFHRISYRESVNKASASNVILDIADKRQTGMTLRYFEAVCYNKKLLTNNANVKNMPYYDERYMKIYNGVEDIAKIEKEWFTSSEDIDYGYKGEFEPKYFLERIEKDLA